MKTFTSLVALSRWREHIGFVVPLTLLGVLLAHRISGSEFNLKILVIFIANFLSVTFAFMINDIEDAEDDLFIPKKALRNPVSSKHVTKKMAYFLSALVAILALSMFFYLGGPVIWAGISLVILSLFYSLRPIRLKSWPLVDVVSHSLMLGGLLILSSFFTYSSDVRNISYLVIAVCLFSAYGQVYNQIRDFDADKKARLRNTTILLGKRWSLRLSHTFLFLGFILISLSIKKGLFPYWVGIFALVGVYLSRRFIRKTDARGSLAVDFTGSLQTPASIIFNVVTLSWFAISFLGSFVY